MKNNGFLKNRSKLRYAACFVVIALLCASLLPLFCSCSLFSTEIVVKTLDIVVDVNQNGVTTFTETVCAKFSEQDTDWWNFFRIINDKKLMNALSAEGGFSVDKTSFYLDGKNIPFSETAIDLDQSNAKEYYTKMYKDSAVGYIFARMEGQNRGVEIGVIMPEFSSGTHTFSYSYSIKGIVSDVTDASVFYYKYLSEINSMDVEKMSVKVNFAGAEPNLQGWLHVSKSAQGVWRSSADGSSVEITVEDIVAGEYVESRFLLEKGRYAASSIDNTMSAARIKEEELAWEKKDRLKRRIDLAITVLDFVLAALSVAAGVFYLFYAKKKNEPLDLPDAPIYYRDIPEGYAGGEVSPLYFYYTNEVYVDESISATMLELVRLKYITITPDEKEKSASITVLKKDEEDLLRTHQKYVIYLLLMPAPMGTSFTMKAFEKYAKKNYEKVMHVIEKYKEAVLNKTQRDGDYRKDNPAKLKAQKFSVSMIVAGVVVVVISGFIGFLAAMGVLSYGHGTFFFGAGLIIGGLIAYLALRKIKAPLTLQGQKEYNKLQALARFMQEFSSMEEHDIPELVLWEDYMIFATAMGIADKVAKQLEIAYPEFKNLSVRGFDADTFLILYFFSGSFRGLTGMNFVGNISNVIRSVQIAEKAAKAAALAKSAGSRFGGGSGGSSFHGGGGGFSGGGFGGRR